MNPKDALLQLKSVVGQRENELACLNLACSLLDDGYKADQAFIDSEIQKAQDEIAGDLATKDAMISDLQVEKESLEIEKAELQKLIDDQA